MTSQEQEPQRTDRTQLREAVAEPDSSASLLLAWKPSSTYTVKQVEVDHVVSAEFLALARDSAADLAGRIPVDYDPEWPLKDHEYFVLAGDEVPTPVLFETLDDFANLPSFDKKHLTKPRLYLVAVQTPSGNAIFGKRMAYLQVLGRKRGVFSAVWDGSTFNALEDSVATFSRRFDWVMWHHRLYILDAGDFHAEFRDTRALQRAVADHVEAISKIIPIEGKDEFTKRCQASVPMASKLKRVAEQGIQGSPIDDLKSYADEYKIPVEWKGDSLVFDGSLERQWAILKLLDEDRTEGPVSKRHYEAAAKRQI